MIHCQATSMSEAEEKDKPLRKRKLHQVIGVRKFLATSPSSWFVRDARRAAVAASFELDEVVAFARECSFETTQVHRIMNTFMMDRLPFLEDWYALAGRALITAYPEVHTMRFVWFLFSIAVRNSDAETIRWLRERSRKTGMVQRYLVECGERPVVHSLEAFNALFPTRKDLLSEIAVCCAAESVDPAVPDRYIAEGIDVSSIKGSYYELITPRTIQGLRLYLEFAPMWRREEQFVLMLCRTMDPELVSFVASHENVKESTFFDAAHLGCPEVVEVLLEKAGSVLNDKSRATLSECVHMCRPVLQRDIPCFCPVCGERTGHYFPIRAYRLR